MNKIYLLVITVLFSIFQFGCSSEDIPPAHKGRMLSRTGILAFYSGGNGFEGPVLSSGTYYTGLYNELRIVECASAVKKEEMKALTKDGVQFSLDVYVRFSANCDDDHAVEKILTKLTPGYSDDKEHPGGKNIIFGVQLYDMIIRPSIGEAVRRSVSVYIANEINTNRDKIFDNFKVEFNKQMLAQKDNIVSVYELNLSNLNFPEELNKANVLRAEQSILKDKAIAERDRVDAEITTAQKRKMLAEAEGLNEAMKIDKIGEALKRNPEYLQFQLQQSMPEIYAKAGEKGNLVIAAPSPITLMHAEKGK